jgi:hypothetical protein
VPGGGVELEPLLRASEPAGEILSEQRESKDLYVPDLSVKVGAGRGSRTPKGRSPADFESAASASSAIPAL